MKQDKEAEKAYFNNYAKKQKYEAFSPEGYRRLLGVFSDLLNHKNGRRVLEIGCGTGAFTKLIANGRFKVIGLDISELCIDKAKEDLPQVDFVVGDMEALSLKDNSVDIIVFGAVLHHLPDISLALEEAFRVLKQGGCCYAFEPNVDNPVMWLFRYRASPFYYRKDLTKNERLLSRDELSAQFMNVGFHDTYIEAISGVYFKTMPNRFFKLLLPIFNFFDNLFTKTPFARKRGVFLTAFATR